MNELIQNVDNDDLNVMTPKNKMIFTNDCSSISSCDSIIRITECLKFYQSLDLISNKKSEELMNYLNAENYPFLIADYNHILVQHLGDNTAQDLSKILASLDYKYKQRCF